MGRQVNFYALPEDLLEMWDLIRTDEGVLLFTTPFREAPPHPVLKPVLEFSRDNSVDHLLIRSADLECLRLTPFGSSGDRFDFHPSSPVLEWTLCNLIDKRLTRGRLYFATGHHGQQGEWVPWQMDFMRWADGCIRRTRRLLKQKNLATRCLITERVADWLRAPGHQLG